MDSVVQFRRIAPTVSLTQILRNSSHVSSVRTSDQVSGANGHHLKVAFNAQSVKVKAIILRNTIVLI